MPKVENTAFIANVNECKDRKSRKQTTGDLATKSLKHV